MGFGLKSLELQGYKTFANRTLFEFSETITAIVGPNGSGKSNIADSIRWVLGEQSFSLLRGRKTEDMIFSGSEQRSRAGMASATITFDNSDGWLPIDFSEVAITRRAYRDGQNEYLINGKRSRLRDVSELLSQSGLAERTYTIIGQGLVDAALALKAEERRRLFEEAAGIGLYRSRREESLRRLDTTRRNLDRVQDILLELEPRLRSLERQSKKAEQYDLVKDDLQIILREWYGYHWHKLQDDLSSAIENAEKQEQELAEVNKRQDHFDKILEENQSQIISLRKVINEFHRNSAELHTNREIVSKELAVVDERFKLLTNRIRELLQEKSSIEEELGKIREKKTNANLEYQEQEQVLIDARNQLESYNQKYLQLEGENEKRQEKLQQVRDRIEYLNIKHGRMQTLHSDRLVQTENFEQKRILNEKHIGALEKHIKETHKDIKDLEGNIASDQQMYKNTEEELADLNDNLRLIQDRKSYLSEEKSKLLEESTRFSAQIDVLKAANANFIGYADGTRSILEAAKTSKLTGVLGPLNNQLSVDEEFENAVSAALGDYFDGVVFDNGVDEALNLLIAHSEKGVLLPLANFNESANDYRNDILEEDGVFGSAVELISVSDGCAPIIRTLLGSTYIVDDRDSARRILKNYKHNYSPSPNSAPDIRLVTLIGEIFHLNGPVLSGISSQDKEAQSLVSRKRRFETLTENLNQITGLIEHTELNLDDVSLDEKRLLNKENIINSEYINLREIIDERSSKLKNLTLELNHSKDKLLWQQEELQDLVNNRSRVKEEIMDISAQISKIDRQISEEQNRYKQLSAENSSHILDDVSASVAHWEKTIAITEQTKHEIDKRISEFQYLSNNTKSQLQSIEEQIKLLNNQISDLEDEKINKRDRELILEKEISKIQSQLSPAESDLGKIEGAQIQIQSKESEVRRELSKAEHQNAQARILLAAKREAVDALRQRIEADIGLVDFDYSESVSGPTPLPIEGYVNQLPHIEQLSPELEISLNRQRALLRRIGPINPEAQAEYKEVNTRFSFLTEQMADLQEAENDIRQVINELDTLMEQEFRKTFEHVSLEFKTIFTRLFNGGDADLILTEPNNFSVSGIDIEARLPGRRPQRLSLLSGGERSLTATALIFALLKVSPTPFCLLDEVDAMLDEANLDRFREMLMELSKETQFVVVTHNRNTVQAADVIYGVTMGRDSASQVVSLKPAELVEG